MTIPRTFKKFLIAIIILAIIIILSVYALVEQSRPEGIPRDAKVSFFIESGFTWKWERDTELAKFSWWASKDPNGSDAAVTVDIYPKKYEKENLQKHYLFSTSSSPSSGQYAVSLDLDSNSYSYRIENFNFTDSQIGNLNDVIGSAYVDDISSVERMSLDKISSWLRS